MQSLPSPLYSLFSRPAVFAELFNQYKCTHPDEAEWPSLDPRRLRLEDTYWLYRHPAFPKDAHQTLVLMEDSRSVDLLALETHPDPQIPFHVWHWGQCLKGWDPATDPVDPHPAWRRKSHFVLAAYLGTDPYAVPVPASLPPDAQERLVDIQQYVPRISFTDQTEAESTAYQTELWELAEALRLARGSSRTELRTLVRAHPLFQDLDADVARLLADLLHTAQPVGKPNARRLNLAQGELLYAESCRRPQPDLTAYPTAS